jgi:NADH-quinone oxidoreductase subunit M
VRESLALAPLVLMIFVIGLSPAPFLDRMKPSIDMFHNQFKTVSGQAVLYADDRAAKILPEDVFSPKFLQGAPVYTTGDAKTGEGATAKADAAGGAK